MRSWRVRCMTIGVTGCSGRQTRQEQRQGHRCLERSDDTHTDVYFQYSGFRTTLWNPQPETV